MKTGITTHVLDLGEGRPASGLAVTLSQQTASGWEVLGDGRTDADGRVGLWRDLSLCVATYRLSFATGDWFAGQSRDCFYPRVDIVFSVDDATTHYHVPLLLNRWGYSTYRGS